MTAPGPESPGSAAPGGYVAPSGYVEPALPEDAVADPFWRDLHGDALLPPAYMPAVMGGRRHPVTRLVALALVTVFVVATLLGECLTYGPGH